MNNKLNSIIIALIIVLVIQTTAVTAAEINIIPDEISLDVNKDGYINLADVAPIKKYVTDKKNNYIANYDLNNDSHIDNADINYFFNNYNNYVSVPKNFNSAFLNFDALYLSTSASDAKLENDIYNAVCNYQQYLDLSDYDNLTANEIKLAYTRVYSFYPYSFCLTRQYSFSTDNKLYFYYRYSEEDYKARLQAVNEAVNNIVSEAKKNSAQIEQARYVFQFLVENSVYDTSLSKYGIDDILIDKTGVCSAYSKAYDLILNKLGIDCTSTTDKAFTHQWNIVNIDNSVFSVDCSKANNAYTYNNYKDIYNFFIKEE